MSPETHARLSAAVEALECLAGELGVQLLAVIAEHDADGNVWCGGTGPDDEVLCRRMFDTFAEMRRTAEETRCASEP